MALNPRAVTEAVLAYDKAISADASTRGKLVAMLDALEAYEAEKAKHEQEQPA